MTAEIKTSFKGYYRTGAHRNALLVRPFLQFEGEGDTANARQREIGGHAAVVLHGVCMLKDPQSPYANNDGYVPRGTLVSYVGGRSNGCTSWSQANADAIMAMTRDDPTTVYIYPEAADIDAVAQPWRPSDRCPRWGSTGTPPASSRSARRNSGRTRRWVRSSPSTAGTTRRRRRGRRRSASEAGRHAFWIPAFAGMTRKNEAALLAPSPAPPCRPICCYSVLRSNSW